MSLHQFLHTLFTENEISKLSDSELSDIIATQFPDHMTTPKMRRSRIPVWRSKYNTGQLGIEPVVFSFRYENGIPVNKNNHPLSDDQIADILSRRARNASAVSEAR